MIRLSEEDAVVRSERVFPYSARRACTLCRLMPDFPFSTILIKEEVTPTVVAADAIESPDCSRNSLSFAPIRWLNIIVAPF